MDKFIAKLLFANDFYSAWKYAPFLMISVVFGSLSGLLGGIFSAAKKSKVFAYSTMLGAIVNTILNFILVYSLGAVGAAISTMVSYFIVWVTRMIVANRIVQLNIRLYRDIVAYILLIFQSLILYTIFENSIYLIQVLFFCIVMYLYLPEFKGCVTKIVCYIKKLIGK